MLASNPASILNQILGHTGIPRAGVNLKRSCSITPPRQPAFLTAPADPSQSVPVSNHNPDAGLSLNAGGEFGP